jgi:hypothetical protein
MSFTSDEVNFLVYRYLQESGVYVVDLFDFQRQLTYLNNVSASLSNCLRQALFIQPTLLAWRVMSVSQTSMEHWCLLQLYLALFKKDFNIQKQS